MEPVDEQCGACADEGSGKDVGGEVGTDIEAAEAYSRGPEAGWCDDIPTGVEQGDGCGGGEGERGMA